MQAEGFKVRLGELREIDSTINILISLNTACGESTALKDRGLAYGALRTKNTLFDPWYRIQNHLFFVAHRNIYTVYTVQVPTTLMTWLYPYDCPCRLRPF